MIGEYFLPSPNKLPRTYRELSAILKEIGMEYRAIDACPNDHITHNDLNRIAHNVKSVDIELIS